MHIVLHTRQVAGAHCTEHDDALSLLLPSVPAHARQCHIIDIAYHIVVDVNGCSVHMLRVPVTVLSRPRNMANIHVCYEPAVTSHTGSRAAPQLTNIRICASRAEGVLANGDAVSVMSHNTGPASFPIVLNPWTPTRGSYSLRSSNTGSSEQHQRISTTLSRVLDCETMAR